MKTKISLATAVVLGASSLYGGSIINDDIIGDSLNKEVRVDNTKVNALEKKVLQLEKTLQSQQKYIKGLELKVNKKSKSKKVVADKEDDMSEQVSTNSDDIEDFFEFLEGWRGSDVVVDLIRGKIEEIQIWLRLLKGAKQ